MKYEYAVYIGRFQPFHVGHLTVVREALKVSEKLIIVLGSSDQPRSLKNPWTFAERKNMIIKTLTLVESSRVMFTFSHDTYRGDLIWIKQIRENVKYYAKNTQKPIGLIGFKKDSSSYYLDLFGDWETIPVKINIDISATDIRRAYFDEVDADLGSVSCQTFSYLMTFTGSIEFKNLKEEHESIKTYRKSWQAAPYPPIFVTVDAVVVHSFHVLLIKRRARPGKGLWALPGGFIKPNETLKSAMLRELYEETKIKLSPLTLRGCIEKNKVYDSPDRSERGRTITHASLLQLDPNHTLPKIKGSDDAEKAKWEPIDEVDRSHMYEDHYMILMDMI